MTISTAAADAARRIWTRAGRGAGQPEKVAASADRLCAQLREGLTRWVGAHGYRVVLDRALGLTQAEHQALRSLSCLGDDESATTNAVRAHGAGAVAAAMVALIATMIDVLGRAVGEDMAVRFVEQTGTPSPRGVVSTESRGRPDG
jgi:hypothetical protein